MSKNNEKLDEKIITADDLEVELDYIIQQDDVVQPGNVVHVSGEASNVEPHQQLDTEKQVGDTVFDTALEELATSGKGKKKSQKVLIILLALAIIFTSGIAFILQRVNARQPIDVFTHFTFPVEGINGAAVVERTLRAVPASNRYTNDELRTFLESIQFDVSQKEGLQNGDTVVMKISADDPAFTNYKFIPITLEKELEIEGLDEMPQTWDTIANQGHIFGLTDTLAELMQGQLQKSFDEQNPDVPQVVITRTHAATYYATTSPEMCAENLGRIMVPTLYCGSAVILYELTLYLPEGYYLADGGADTLYVPIFTTGIINTTTGETKGAVFQSDLFSETFLEGDIATISAQLAEQNFVKI